MMLISTVKITPKGSHIELKSLQLNGQQKKLFNLKTTKWNHNSEPGTCVGKQYIQKNKYYPVNSGHRHFFQRKIMHQVTANFVFGRDWSTNELLNCSIKNYMTSARNKVKGLSPLSKSINESGNPVVHILSLQNFSIDLFSKIRTLEHSCNSYYYEEQFQVKVSSAPFWPLRLLQPAARWLQQSYLRRNQ